MTKHSEQCKTDETADNKAYRSNVDTSKILKMTASDMTW